MSLALFTHVSCVLGGYVACQRALKTYIAILALVRSVKSDPTIPTSLKDTVQEEAPAPAPAQSPAARPWWRRLFTRESLEAFAAPLAFLAVQFGFSLTLAHFSTQLIMDTVFVLIVFWFASFNIYYPIPFFARTTPRWTITVTLAASIIVSAFFGSKVPALILPVAPLINLGGHTFFPKVSVRRIIQATNGILIFSVIFVTTLIYGVIGVGDEKKAQKSNTVVASPWILDLVTMLGVGMVLSVPCVMLSISLRYHHASHAVSSELPPVVDQTAITPRSAPRFPAPIFRAGMAALVAGIAFLDLGLPRVVELDPDMQMAASLFVGIPCTSAGLMLGAWWAGKFEDWWMYTDEWFPALSHNARLPAADEEKALISEDAQVEDLVQLEEKRAVEI